MSFNPGQKGWLAEYLEFRKTEFLSFFESTAEDSHPEHSLYRLLQPNGMMYGYPVISKSTGSNNDAALTELNRMKVLMAESLINGSLILHHQEINNEDDFSDVILKTIYNIGEFYKKIYPELAIASRTLFGRKKSPLEIAERVLEKRILMRMKNSEDFWMSFFNNSLLFLDIYFFGQWIHTGSEEEVAEFFKQEKEALRFSVIKVISAAAHANQIIEEEEQSLFNHFLTSSHLTPPQKKEAKQIFQDGVDVHDIALPTHNSWILKKYFLELAILTVWSDRQLEESEYQFLTKFTEVLGFFAEDLDNSLLAVEGFVLEHWEQLEKLRKEHTYANVSNQYLARIKKMVEKNARRIAKEMKTKSKMVELLSKASSELLSDEESNELKTDLIQVLKTVPTFVIVGLPSTYLSLPMLLKILPVNLMNDY